MAAFVTDGDQRATLAVVRALGGAGIQVTVGESTTTSLAGASRYCTSRVRYPSPLEKGGSFQEFLEREVASGRYRVLFPMTDVTTLMAAQVREVLEGQVGLPIPAEKQIRLAQDKRGVHSLALRLGIDVPETFMLDEKDDLEDVTRRIRFPAVIKPRFSRFFRNGVWVTGSVEYAQNAEDLIAKYRAIHARIPHPLVQERVEGEARGVFLCVWDSELKAAFCHRRLREKPPWGGVSVYCESLALNDDLVKKSFELLSAIGWNGVAMVEFKRDRRDGKAKLMEINGRFWGSLQLAIDAGMNFPLLVYRLASGESVPAQVDYKVGVKSRWALGDLDHLLIRLRYPQGPAGLASNGESRLVECLKFLKFCERDLHYDVLRLDDPRPGWYEFKSYLGATWRQFGRHT